MICAVGSERNACCAAESTQRVLVFKTAKLVPLVVQGEHSVVLTIRFGNDTHAYPQSLGLAEITLADTLPSCHARVGVCRQRVAHQNPPLNLDCHGLCSLRVEHVCSSSERWP